MLNNNNFFSTMKTAAVGTILWLCFVPSCAFVNASPRRSNVILSPAIQNSPTNFLRQEEELRGGGLLKASASDYSDAAKALFGNMVSPAAMLAGGMVPLGFLAPPLPDDGKPWKKKAKCLYMALSVLNIANELLAIMYATVTCNKLTETAVAPASSVFALIKRDYELPWIATNVHFMLGLFGFMGMIMLRALTFFPATLNFATAGMAFSALLGMVSIVNVGVAEGDGRGHKLGGNIFTLGVRYAALLVKECAQKKTILGAVSTAMFLFFGFLTVMNLFQSESQ